MRKKAKKSKAQITAEEYFPVDERDVKYAVEKLYKPNDATFTEIMQPKEKKKRKTKRIIKKSGKKPEKSKKEYKIPEINLKENGYELIVTEKPQAALKIADALGKSEKRNLHGIPYYEVTRNGKEIVVACAVGHLFTLSQTQRGSG